MAVESSSDFSSYMDDWGEAFELNGVTFNVDFSAIRPEEFDTSVEEAHGWVLADAMPSLADGDIVVRVSTGNRYRILQIDKTNVSHPSPGWALHLKKQ